jgi:L-ascorbate metabolism protein UlaG (beta-lactamase superfamily)
MGLTAETEQHGKGCKKSTGAVGSMTALKPAFCKGPQLQTQILEARGNGNADSFDIWWFGQSGFLIQWDKKLLLFDPYLSDSLTKKYLTSNKPHTRVTEKVIEPHLLSGINIVTSSHNHTDHLDADTLIPLLVLNPDIKFIIPEANRDFVADRVKCNRDFPIGLNDGETFHHLGFTLHGVPAAHNELERDEHGRCKYMGYVVKFGRWTVYHSGDTLRYHSMVDVLKPFKIDVAFLPINGNDPSRGVAGNLNAAEAAQLGKEIGAKVVIPHHYDMFTFNTADPDDFVKEAKRMEQEYYVMRLGERWKSEAR